MMQAATRHASQPVQIPVADVRLAGDLTVPSTCRGLVLFAHGSGSSRQSPRNRFVAEVLNDAGLATLLFDLLTAEEEQLDRVTTELRFDIPLLAERLMDAIDWTRTKPALSGLRIGLFGASTGAAAALIAAAGRPADVSAVVSRGGRPDFAGNFLEVVAAPTLLIVGELDATVIQLNESARDQMTAPTTIEIVANATHLFEEPGTLEQVARLARQWFVTHLVHT